jgi:tetratricopeptide (TPR) repeat protein
MKKQTLKRIALNSVITLILLAFSGWLIVHNWQYRKMYHENYAFTVEEANTLKNFPRALYAYGLNAWYQNDSDAAAHFFSQAVSKDIFFMDAWLRLAQAEVDRGNLEKAGTILRFTDHLTQNVYRWKWDQTLLARELDMSEILLRNINFLIGHRKMVPDAFQLLDFHLNRSVAAAAEVLDPDNLVLFLKWLMRWGRVEDAYIVWHKIDKHGIVDEDIRLKYVNFLIGTKHVPRAAKIWRAYTKLDGIANAGFEHEITHQGFDWRYMGDTKGNWSIRRTFSEALAGTHSLKIMFAGKENLSFGHLYQIVPVDSLTPYRLTYHWRSKDLTTDQGPFVDVYGYDRKGIYFKGPMMLGTHDWQEQAVDFFVPENCHAVVIRLRRLPSKRFDSKIAGTLWLDDFRLEKMRP